LAIGPARVRLAAGAVLGASAAVAVALVANAEPAVMDNLGTSAQSSEGAVVALVAAAMAVAAGGVRWAIDRRLHEVSLPKAARRWGALAVVAAAVAGLLVANPFAKLNQLE